MCPGSNGGVPVLPAANLRCHALGGEGADRADTIAYEAVPCLFSVFPSVKCCCLIVGLPQQVQHGDAWPKPHRWVWRDARLVNFCRRSEAIKAAWTAKAHVLEAKHHEPRVHPWSFGAQRWAKGHARGLLHTGMSETLQRSSTPVPHACLSTNTRCHAKLLVHLHCTVRNDGSGSAHTGPWWFHKFKKKAPVERCSEIHAVL